ncbi:MAG: hypothetical protein ACRENP_17045 [Longimicrobiales bacterium]
MIDQIALVDDLPEKLVRRVNGVRLSAPNLLSIDLIAPWLLLPDDGHAQRGTLAGRAGGSVRRGDRLSAAISRSTTNEAWFRFG